jgi:hypothetical protein
MRNILMCLLCAAEVGGAATYNVTTDWSNSSNPNGVWSYNQGSTPLPFQSSLGAGTCFNTAPGITGGWAPGINFFQPCISAFFKATGAGYTANDYQAGDVVVHSQDTTNGVGEGQASLVWTAPAAGTISFSGAVWYAHSIVARSNDFKLSLNSVTLASGTVTLANNRSNMMTFSNARIPVQAGNQVILTIQRSSGQTYGSLAGLQLSIVEATAQPAFFTGEVSLGSGVYYLQFPDSNPFGYYNFPSGSILYHYDLGFEAFVAGTGTADIYLYDFTSHDWWYTSASLFPYLYDFTLNSWLYYLPNTANPGHYTANPRYFSNLTTGKIFTM